MPAALLPLEDEPPRTVLEEHPQQARRRDVQVRRDALGFEFACLVGPAAGDDRERRLVRADRFELLRADLVRHEPEDADAPRVASRASPSSPARSCSGLGLAEQRQGQERQAAAVGDRVRERGACR